MSVSIDLQTKVSLLSHLQRLLVKCRMRKVKFSVKGYRSTVLSPISFADRKLLCCSVTFSCRVWGKHGRHFYFSSCVTVLTLSPGVYRWWHNIGVYTPQIRPSKLFMEYRNNVVRMDLFHFQFGNSKQTDYSNGTGSLLRIVKHNEY